MTSRKSVTSYHIQCCKKYPDFLCFCIFPTLNLPSGMILSGILFQKRYHFFVWKFGVIYCRPAILSNYLLKPDQRRP